MLYESTPSTIEQLGRDEAGKLTPSDGETIATVRRRLGSAVKASGKSIQIKRAGAEIYFWEEPPKPRVGRARRNFNPRCPFRAGLYK